MVGFEEPRQAAEQASTPAEIEERRRPGRNDHVSPPLIPLLRNPAAPTGDDWAPVIDVIPIASFADLIDGVDDPGIAGQGSETPGFVT